jgi:DNA helicase-2/ATP-dependent DNA helicase PcrA
MEKQQLLNKILNEPTKLSDAQRNAVVSDNRYIRVIAGAGTGKTETLTRRIVYLLLHEEVEPRNIVAFTFTEKAAQQMKSRIYDRVRYICGEQACVKLGEMYVGTIHSYCMRILQDYFDYGEYNVLDENQEIAFVLRKADQLGKSSIGRNERNYSEYSQRFLKSVNVVYDELIERTKVAQTSADFFEYMKRYEELLEKHRLLTFGQMIYRAVQSLEANPKALNHIQHLIVDEYQDINRAQERLIQIIGKESSVFVVGDPRQSIYQWRGSDEKCFDDFVKNFKPSETFQIKENRRSTHEIVAVANEFADTFHDFNYDHITPLRTEKGAAIKLVFDTPEKEAKWITQQIKHAVEEKKYCNYNDFAILMRSVTTSAEPFIKEFKQQNIPYLVAGKVGLFKRQEAQAVGMLFCWLSEDGFYAPDRYKWAEQIQNDDLLEEGIQLWSDATHLAISETIEGELFKWKENIYAGKYENFIQIYHDLLVILGFRKLDPTDKNQAAVMANLGRFSNLLTDYESSIRLGGQLPDWTEVFDGLCWYINTYASGAYEEQPAEDIRSTNAVQIMTVHQAKGLEWPIVFIPALTNIRFPTSRLGASQQWYISTELFPVERYESRDKKGNKLYDSERKLFYVAITRARDLLCFSSFKKIKKKQAPSIFLKSIEKLLTEIKPAASLPYVSISSATEEGEIQTFSVKEITYYRKCPFFYRLLNIWNYSQGISAGWGYGKSLHYCLHYATELIQNEKKIKIEDAISHTIDAKFHVPYAGGIVKDNMKKKAKKVLSKFVKEYEADIYKIQATEVRLEFPVQKATIAGRVDVILKHNNLTEIRDYKTSEEVITAEEGALQVQLYALGLKMAGKEINQGSVAYLEASTVKNIDVSESSLLNAKNIAELTITKIKNADYHPTPCLFCKECAYQKICRYNINQSPSP